MNNITSIVMDEWKSCEAHANHRNKVYYIMHPIVYVMKCYHG